ncbi:MAG: C39 family peptidase [Anaerolineae bacterium]|nr:C39 family peptidase [Anaerolineae bacterium]
MALAAGRALIRALPGRYAYYLPEPLLALRQVEHADVLPTPVAPAAVVLPTATPVPTATPTSPPEATLTPLPTATPLPTPTATPTLPPHAFLEGLRHEHQGWNNCGPTTLTMLLSYWERTETQYDAAPVLKPDPEDKNVSPGEMVAYAQSLGLDALARVGGDLDLLKRLIAGGFPVIVETWEVRDARDQLGHYRLIVGYDDATQEFATYDSLHGPDVLVGYRELDELWKVFNRVYILALPPERMPDLATLLGPALDAEAALRQALESAQAELAAPETSCVAYAACRDAATFAWFNAGSSLAALGDMQGAVAAFDQARALGLPFRMLWYQFEPYAAYDAVGRYDDVIVLADELLRVTPNLEESYFWRGRARLALGDCDGARKDFEAALRYHPDWEPALLALDGM